MTAAGVDLGAALTTGISDAAATAVEDAAAAITSAADAVVSSSAAAVVASSSAAAVVDSSSAAVETSAAAAVGTSSAAVESSSAAFFTIGGASSGFITVTTTVTTTVTDAAHTDAAQTQSASPTQSVNPEQTENNNDNNNAAVEQSSIEGLDFGLCVPTMKFVGGLNGRPADEFTFQAIDPLVAEGQQEALNPNIITNRICDQLVNVCEANQAAIDACEAAKAQIEALGTRDRSTAETWNALMGFEGADTDPDN